MNGEPTPRQRSWSRYLILVGLALVTALLWHFGAANLAGQVRDAARGPLALMAILVLVGFWIRAWKWHYALGPHQQGVLLFFLAKTAGNWTPGRAGELAPLLLREHRNTRVAAWIGLDRAVEVSATLGLGLVGAAWIGMVPWAITILVLAAVFAGLVLAITLVHRQGPATLESGTGLRGLTRRFYAELLLFRQKTPLVLLLTAVAKVTDVYAVILLCEAFGYPVSFWLVCAARCAHGLVSAIPVTPDATGVPYAAAAWLLHDRASIPYDTLTAALGLEVFVINAILWACFCLVSGLRWNKRTNG